MRRRVSAAVLVATAVACTVSRAADSESETTAANKLYQQALVESDGAAKLEKRGKKQAAIDSYEFAGKLAEASIAEAERTGIPEGDRPPEIYFRCATAYLQAGRLLADDKNGAARTDEDLRKAVLYLGLVEKLEKDRAERTKSPINPEIWRVRNAEGYACFLSGELAQARLHYGSVLEMNPSYKPAEDAIAEINKIERQQNELFSPQGPTLQKEKRRKVLHGIVDTLRLVKDIVRLGL
ncbi:MAG: hypothetical protein ABR526_05385 [Chthoniobacterales bacterium]